MSHNAALNGVSLLFTNVLNLLIVLKEHNQASQCQFINYKITLILFTLQNQIRNFCRNNFDRVHRPNINYYYLHK